MAKKPARPNRCGLTLKIRGQAYRVRPLPAPAHGPTARAFQLTKPDGTTYDVSETPHGPTCDCGDQVFRREHLDPRGCKHVRALVALRMIVNPNLDPKLEPLPARRES